MNLVKTADPQIAGDAAIEDYLRNFQKFYPLGSFITLNLSCPNTIEGRTFEDPQLLGPFLRRVQETRESLLPTVRKPVLIKLSPDLEDSVLDEILRLARLHRMDGCVIANTTARRDNLKTTRKAADRFGFGGLSGRPLKPYVQEMVRKVYAKTEGQLPIVACGGVGCDPDRHPAEEVWEYLNLGATLVQVHTGLIYRGPAMAQMVNRGLAKILEANRISSLQAYLDRRPRPTDNFPRRSTEIHGNN
jgi:dihydroorotate dehydrogenase